MTDSLEVRTLHVKPGGVLRLLAALTLIPSALLLIVGFRMLGTLPVSLFGAGFLLAIPPALFLYRSRARPGTRVRRVDGGVQIGERVLADADIIDTYESGTHVATLRLADFTTYQLRFVRPAAEALAALGFAPDQRVVREPLIQALSSLTLGFLAFVVTIIPFGMLFASMQLLGLGLAFALSCLCAWATARTFGHPAIVVGADGVRLMVGVRSRFIPYSELSSVRALGQAVTLFGRDGSVHNVRPVGSPIGLAERIERSRRAAESGGAFRVEALARAERSLERWREDLQALVSRAGGFRDVPVDAQSLEFALRDTGAAADRRIGAALALRAAAPEHVERVRLVAEACADPALREALEAVCDDSLDERLLARAERRR